MDLTLRDLPSYLNQIHTFLIKNGKSYVFPSLTMGMEDILVSIVKDPNFLKKFDDQECKSIARQIIEILEENKHIYTLSFSFENYEHWKRVMMYKKIPVPVPIFNEPLGLKQLRKPHSPISQTASLNDSTNTNLVMSSFKVTCLNATLKFVKNDNQLVLQYPDVSTEQAEFIKHMIAQCLSPKNSSTTPGGRGMFEPLAEALKIYGTKYEFKLNNAVPVKIDMKRLFFEKIHKKKDWWPQIPQKISEKEFDTISLSSISSEDSPDSHNTFAKLLKSLDCTFIRNTIFDIEEFLLQDKEKIEFQNLTIPEENFTMHWKSGLIVSDVMKLFDEDVRDSLKNIRTLLMKCSGVCKIRTTMQKVSPKLRNVILRKKWKKCYDPKGLTQIPDYADMAKQALIKVKTENDVNYTTTDSVPTTKKTENSLPIRIVKSENDVYSMTVNLNSVAKVTDTITVAVHTNKNMIENDIIYDNAPANSMPTIELKKEPEKSVKVNNMMEVTKETNLNTIPTLNDPVSICTETSKAHNRTLFLSSANNISREVTSEINSTVNSWAKENTSVNSLADKESAEMYKLPSNDGIPEVTPATNSTVNSSAKENASVNSLTDKYSAEICALPLNVGVSEVTPESNATVNSSTIMNASVNSLTDKVNAEICKLNRDDFIVNRNPQLLSNIQSDMKLKKLKHILLLRSLLNANGAFVENTINKIKEFILSAREMLNFTQLSKDEQDLLLNWEYLINSNEIVCMYCARGQCLVDEIRQLFEKGRGSFSIAITSKTCSAINRTITFTKTIKKKPTQDVKTASNVVYPDLLAKLVPLSSVPTQKPVQHGKKIQKFLNKTDNISEEWMISSLKQLRSFIIDDAQASLVLYNLDQQKTAFLTKWQKVLAKEEVIATYGLNIQSLLLNVHKCMAEKMSKFRISSKSTSVRADQTRDLTFVKVPYYGNSKSQVSEKNAPKVKKKKVENTAQTSVNKTEIATNIEATKRNAIPTQPVEKVSFTNMYIALRKKLNEKIPKEIVPANQIPKSSSVTSLCVKKVPVSSERGRPKSATVKHSLPHQQAKAKLIEALSQPLVSERGLKMMRNMGWDGGALGLRGEGIVEPIALPLDLKRGAGLGSNKDPIHHPKLPAMTNLPVNITRVVLPHSPGKNELKMGFLQTILNMLKTVQPATELSFPNKLTLTDWTFVKQSVLTINKRVIPKHDAPALVELSDKIVKALSENHYIITACLGVSKKNVLFLLLKNCYQPLELDSKDWCSVVNIEKDKSEKLLVNPNNVIVIGEVFRYYVLSHILEFCQPKITIDKVPAKTSLPKEIALKGTMVPKHMSYIKDLVQRLNHKSRSSSDYEKEKVIFDQIKEVMHGFTLDVDFPVAKCADENKPPVYNVIRFYKIFDTKQNSPTHRAKIDVNNEKAVAKDRISFTTDTFDEKYMFDSQDKPISDKNAPKSDENEPTLSNLKHGGDCICCLQDYEMKDVDKDDERKDVEYIFLEKETVESEDIRPVDTVIQENTISDNFNEDKDKTSMTIDNLDEEKNKTMTIENLDEEKDKIMTIENLDEEKDKTSMTVENLDEEKDKTPKITENLDEDIQNLSISDKNTDWIGFSGDIKLFLEKNAQTQNSNDQESKDICKRPISNSSTPDRVYKKVRCEKFSKKINITPNNYPESEITNEIASKIQNSILESIDYAEELPLLECHGIQNGGLAYSCHTETSLNFITKLMSSLNFLVTLAEEENKCHKMTVKIRSFVKEGVDAIFDRLETYNMSLDTKSWKVIDIERSRDSVVISMKVDEDSFKFIYKQNFTLFTGIDQAKFSILWD